MANKKEVVLSDRDQDFIHQLIINKGNISKAAEAIGVSPQYGYTMRDRLAEHIAEAAHKYIAIHSVKAAAKMIEALDNDMPNPVQITAAKDILDRAGVKTVNEQDQITIRPNIFILPEKRMINITPEEISKVIEHE